MMPAFRSRFQGLASSPTVKPPCFDQWLTLDLSNLCGQVGRANDLNRLTPVKPGISRALSAVCPRNPFGARSLIPSSTAFAPCHVGSKWLGDRLEFLVAKKQTFSGSEQQALRNVEAWQHGNARRSLARKPCRARHD